LLEKEDHMQRTEDQFITMGEHMLLVRAQQPTIHIRTVSTAQIHYHQVVTVPLKLAVSARNPVPIGI
jgi:hypothetical protein